MCAIMGPEIGGLGPDLSALQRIRRWSLGAASSERSKLSVKGLPLALEAVFSKAKSPTTAI